MLDRAHYQSRRDAFLDRLAAADLGPVLLMAGNEIPRNYPDNIVPYRADSNFLYFFAQPEAGSAALFDPEERAVTLFLRTRTAEDELWHGPKPSFEDVRASSGATDVRAVEDLEDGVASLARGRDVRSLAVVDPRATARARSITGEALVFEDAERIGSRELIAAIGELRARKTDAEIDAMRKTAAITAEAHKAAMAHSRPGVHEQELAGIVTGVFARHGCVPAYNSILSVRGEVLHNTHYVNTLADGDTVLLDAGAEHASGYCSDVTRSWPASGSFTSEAAEIYDIVLAAEEAGIAQVRAGTRFRDVHLASARVVADGLAQLGVLRGSPDELLEVGAHALFFPHGVGHLIGIDVHDMEAFGDAISYPAGRERSTQFGLGYLRLDIDLEAGMCFTVEPGIYFIPGILENPEWRAKFDGYVDWARAESYLAMNDGRGFGGVRLEDDVLCTETGSEVLTHETPKARAEVEGLVGTA